MTLWTFWECMRTPQCFSILFYPQLNLMKIFWCNVNLAKVISWFWLRRILHWVCCDMWSRVWMLRGVLPVGRIHHTLLVSHFLDRVISSNTPLGPYLLLIWYSDSICLLLVLDKILIFCHQSMICLGCLSFTYILQFSWALVLAKLNCILHRLYPYGLSFYFYFVFHYHAVSLLYLIW